MYNVPPLSNTLVAHPYMEQFLSQLVMLLWYGRQLDDTTGVLIWAIMELTKLEMGLLGALFQTPLTFCDLMTETWIKWLWVDCVHYNFKIFTDITDFPLPQSSNIKLMWLFVQNGCWGHDLSILNWCQMALRVIWLSNICTGSGREISCNAWEGKVDSEYQYQWIQSTPTGPADWQLWQVTLQRYFG